MAEEFASGKPLYYSQTDIRQHLDTKAAAYTMVECLMETAGVTADDRFHLYLSGAFTAHSDLESAITIGIFPELPRENCCVQFASIPGFLVRMQAAKFIPHTDMRWYPSVQDRF